MPHQRQRGWLLHKTSEKPLPEFNRWSPVQKVQKRGPKIAKNCILQNTTKSQKKKFDHHFEEVP